jgi:phosphinothricin acetyltransferase
MTTTRARESPLPSVRPVREGDWPALTELYNHYVVETAITFDVEPSNVEQRRARFAPVAADGPYRLLVAEQDGIAVGYAASMPFRSKAAYATTVETSIYLHARACGQGVGRLLYEALFAALRGQDLRRAVAGVTLPNPRSVALHQRVGFTSIGVFHEVGRKLGRYWDVEWFERPLG